MGSVATSAAAMTWCHSFLDAVVGERCRRRLILPAQFHKPSTRVTQLVGDFRAYPRPAPTIEDALHWVLDVTFREDHGRVRDRTAVRNFAVPRKVALSLITRDQSRTQVNEADASRPHGTTATCDASSSHDAWSSQEFSCVTPAAT